MSITVLLQRQLYILSCRIPNLELFQRELRLLRQDLTEIVVRRARCNNPISMAIITENNSVLSTIFEKDPSTPHRHHQRQDSCPMASDISAVRTDFGGHELRKSYEPRKLANPAPLGFCAFALSSFVLSAVNTHARGIRDPNIVVPLAFGYGGLVQLLAGMW